MERIALGQSVLLSGPQPFAAIVSQTEEGKINVMGVSWFTFVSLRDSKMLFCTANKGYTGSVVKETKKAALCLVAQSGKEQILRCSASTGWNTDKAAEFALETVLPDGFKTPVLKDSTVCWDLELCDTMPEGDHTIYVMDVKSVVRVSERPHLMAFDAYKRLDVL